jgi:hypothetical protein
MPFDGNLVCAFLAYNAATVDNMVIIVKINNVEMFSYGTYTSQSYPQIRGIIPNVKAGSTISCYYYGKSNYFPNQDQGALISIAAI